MNLLPRDTDHDTTFHHDEEWWAHNYHQDGATWASYAFSDATGLPTTSSDSGQSEVIVTQPNNPPYEYTSVPYVYADGTEDSSASHAETPGAHQSMPEPWQSLHVDRESNSPWNHVHAMTDSASLHSQYYVTGQFDLEDLRPGRQFDEYTLRPLRGEASSSASHNSASNSSYIRSTSPSAYNLGVLDGLPTQEDHMSNVRLYGTRIAPNNVISVPHDPWASSPVDYPLLSPVSNLRRSSPTTVHPLRQLSSQLSYIGARWPMPEHDNVWEDDERESFLATAPSSATPASSASYYGTSTPRTQDLADCSRDDISNDEGGSLTCDKCDSSFSRPADLRRHMQKHDEPTYVCEVRGCMRGFYRKDKLRDHVRRAHKGDIITSNGCLEFDVPEEVSSTTPKTFSCPDCHKVFATPGLQRSHIHRKHIRRYACVTCEANFHLKADLRRHELNVHKRSSTETYSCPNAGCKFTMSRRDNLRRHARHCKHTPSTSL